MVGEAVDHAAFREHAGPARPILALPRFYCTACDSHGVHLPGCPLY